MAGKMVRKKPDTARARAPVVKTVITSDRIAASDI